MDFYNFGSSDLHGDQHIYNVYIYIYVFVLYFLIFSGGYVLGWTF